MHLRHAAPLLQLRAQPQGLIAGYASAFDTVDSFGERVARGAFVASLRQHAEAGTRPLMLWHHQPASPIGRWDELAEDSRGLLVSGSINMKTQAGRDAFECLAADNLNGLSIGFRPVKSTTLADDVVELTEVDLVEVSLVSLPANPQARITHVRAHVEAPTSLRALEQALREQLGFSRREAAAVAARGFGALEAEQDQSAELAALQQALQGALATFR
jgi:HK97 family phage prohead protease